MTHTKKNYVGKIAPHEGIELELLLSGEKKVALFGKNEIPNDIFPYLNNLSLCLIQKEILTKRGISLQANIIFKEENRESANELFQTLSNAYSCENYLKEFDIKIGELLSYTKDDIDFFIKSRYKSEI